MAIAIVDVVVAAMGIVALVAVVGGLVILGTGLFEIVTGRRPPLFLLRGFANNPTSVDGWSRWHWRGHGLAATAVGGLLVLLAIWTVISAARLKA